MRSFFASLDGKRRYVVFELFAAYFVLGVSMIMLGAVLPMLKEAYQLDYKTGGLLLSFQSIGYIAVGLVTGAASLRFGLKRAYLGLYLAMLVGLVMLLVNGAPLWLLAAMLLIGLTKGSVTDYNNSVINVYSGGSATPLNLLHACFAIGACVAPFIVLFCTASGADGWRIAIAIAAVLTAVTFVTGLFMDMGKPAKQETAAGPERAFGFLGERLFWQTALIGFGYQAIEASFMGWQTTFYVDTGVMGVEAAQLLTSALWVSLLIGRLACSVIAARFRPHRMILVMCVGIAAFLALLIAGRSLPVMLVATLGLGLCMSGMYGTSVANAGATFARYPVSMGIFVSFTGLGAALAPTAIGVLADRAGMRAGFGVLLAAGLLLVAVAVVNTLYFRAGSADAPA